ncbi:hypothetical protein GCM10023143_09220 [Compostibacter hankyongensis]|uniref:F5/8 type C domain-containing protein n=2 Tax=Compostibacter hankyongensis TaxID=1007089 RepID=A0ABP8FIJ2_9BACT
MDEPYKQFLVKGGKTYVGRAVAAIAHSGRNRVKISWLRGSDPAVTKARIFWDNYTDSVEVEIPSGGDTVSAIIGDLPEKPYTFEVVTYDDMGHSSVPVELLTRAYGDSYQAGLLSRPVNQNTLFPGGTHVFLEWGASNISGGAYATDIVYTDTLGREQTVRIPAGTDTSSMDIKPGTLFRHRTVYLPDSLSIDTFYTDLEQNTDYQLYKQDWRVIDSSTAHPGADNIASHIIDGNPGTRWHTWVDHSQYPHFVTVDMQRQEKINRFEVFRMTGDERACNSFQLLVSRDNVSWTDLGVFSFNRLTDDGQFYEIPSQPEARYFKFVGLSGPMTYMVMGEIGVYGF